MFAYENRKKGEFVPMWQGVDAKGNSNSAYKDFYEYLDAKGAFSYADNHPDRCKPGQKVFFVVDKAAPESVRKYKPVLIAVKDESAPNGYAIIGSISSNMRSTDENVRALMRKLIDDVNKNADASEQDFYVYPATTTIERLHPGLVPTEKKEHRLNKSMKDSSKARVAIKTNGGLIDKAGNQVDMSKVVGKTEKGRAYILIEDANGDYVPMIVRPVTLNPDSMKMLENEGSSLLAELKAKIGEMLNPLTKGATDDEAAQKTNKKDFQTGFKNVQSIVNLIGSGVHLSLNYDKDGNPFVTVYEFEKDAKGKPISVTDENGVERYKINKSTRVNTNNKGSKDEMTARILGAIAAINVKFNCNVKNIGKLAEEGLLISNLKPGFDEAGIHTSGANVSIKAIDIGSGVRPAPAPKPEVTTKSIEVEFYGRKFTIKNSDPDVIDNFTIGNLDEVAKSDVYDEEGNLQDINVKAAVILEALNVEPNILGVKLAKLNDGTFFYHDVDGNKAGHKNLLQIQELHKDKFAKRAQELLEEIEDAESDPDASTNIPSVLEQMNELVTYGMNAPDKSVYPVDVMPYANKLKDVIDRYRRQNEPATPAAEPTVADQLVDHLRVSGIEVVDMSAQTVRTAGELTEDEKKRLVEEIIGKPITLSTGKTVKLTREDVAKVRNKILKRSELYADLGLSRPEAKELDIKLNAPYIVSDKTETVAGKDYRKIGIRAYNRLGGKDISGGGIGLNFDEIDDESFDAIASCSPNRIEATEVRFNSDGKCAATVRVFLDNQAFEADVVLKSIPEAVQALMSPSIPADAQEMSRRSKNRKGYNDTSEFHLSKIDYELSNSIFDVESERSYKEEIQSFIESLPADTDTTSGVWYLSKDSKRLFRINTSLANYEENKKETTFGFEVVDWYNLETVSSQIANDIRDEYKTNGTLLNSVFTQYEDKNGSLFRSDGILPVGETNRDNDGLAQEASPGESDGGADTGDSRGNLGGSRVTQDDKSFYRGQYDEPTIDKQGNLVLYGREDELYKRAGYNIDTGVSVTRDMETAFDYAMGQLETRQNLASESFDENELDETYENGYYVIQMRDNVANREIKEAGESKLVGDVVIPKGSYVVEHYSADGDLIETIGGIEATSSDDRQEMRTADGREVLGYAHNGRIYLDLKRLNPEAPVHEYTHVWDAKVRQLFPEMWAQGVKLMKEGLPDLWRQIENDESYGKKWVAQGKTGEELEFLIASEVHARALGGAFSRALDLKKEEGTSGIIGKLKQWFRDVFAKLAQTFGTWRQEDIDKLTLSQFMNMTLRDFVEGVNPNTAKRVEVQKETPQSAGESNDGGAEAGTGSVTGTHSGIRGMTGRNRRGSFKSERKPLDRIFRIVDIPKELKTLRKYIPQLAREDALMIVDSLIKVGEKGPLAQGLYRRGVMTISKKGVRGTVYHEAFHDLFDTVLDEETKAQLIDETRKLYNLPTDIQAEEVLADQFKEYMLGLEEMSLLDKIANFFRKLLLLVTHRNAIAPTAQRVFSAVTSGEYRRTDFADTHKSFEQEKLEQMSELGYGEDDVQALDKHKDSFESLDVVRRALLDDYGITEEMYDRMSPTAKENLFVCI